MASCFNLSFGFKPSSSLFKSRTKSNSLKCLMQTLVFLDLTCVLQVTSSHSFLYLLFDGNGKLGRSPFLPTWFLQCEMQHLMEYFFLSFPSIELSFTASSPVSLLDPGCDMILLPKIPKSFLGHLNQIFMVRFKYIFPARLNIYPISRFRISYGREFSIIKSFNFILF